MITAGTGGPRGGRGRGQASLTRVSGVRVGHWSDSEARTGCSVVLLPAGTVASGQIAGGAPGTREWALLDPERTVDRIDAVTLAGGSAFGLAAADGVVSWCAERGIGFPTPAGPVPIVVGLVLYDLMVGDPHARPGPAEGYQACQSALGGTAAVGRGQVGAGTGATIGKWRGPGTGRDGGLGSAWAAQDGAVVAALVAVNAVGEPRGGEPELRVPWQPVGPASGPVGGQGSAGGSGPVSGSGGDPGSLPGSGPDGGSGSESGSGGGPESVGHLQSTTIGVIATNARLSKAGCLRIAQSGHDGLARALDPVHTGADGDGLVAVSTGEVDSPLETVRALAAWVVEQAVLDAVGE